MTEELRKQIEEQVASLSVLERERWQRVQAAEPVFKGAEEAFIKIRSSWSEVYNEMNTLKTLLKTEATKQ